MKNKNVVIFGGISIVLVIIAILFMVISPEKKESNDVQFTDYEAYIDIGTKVKFDFKVKCIKDECDVPKVIDYEIIDDSVKQIYVDFEMDINSELNEAIEEMIKNVNKSAMDFEVVKVFTTWPSFSKYSKNIDTQGKEIYFVDKKVFFEENAVLENPEEIMTTTTTKAIALTKTTTRKNTKTTTTKKKVTTTKKSENINDDKTTTKPTTTTKKIETPTTEKVTEPAEENETTTTTAELVETEEN